MALMRPVYSEAQLRELEKLSRAEVFFYTACRDQLPDTVLVIHSSSFAQRSKDGLHVGEIDFVLAFADAGLMVVEVKGGSISRDDSGNWSSKGKKGEHEIKNPVDQARKQRYALQKIIDGHPKWKEWTGGRIIYAPAVFFPNVKPDGLVAFQNAFADQVSFGGRADLSALPIWTASVNEFWGSAKNAHTLGLLGLKLVEEILYPTIEVASVAISSLGTFRVSSEQSPTTPPPEDELTTPTTKSWEEIRRHVSPDPQSPPFVIKKRGGAIELTREWNPELSEFIWTKESKGDLSFLSDWEELLLKRVKKAGVKKRVRWVNMFSASSPLHMCDLPREQQPHSHSIVRTRDAGPTLDVWQCMHPRVEGHPQPHPFVAQQRYLQLVRGILIALEDFHFKGFVHCDLHSGNVALPVKGTISLQHSADRGEHFELEPMWDDMCIIDLDFSASQSIAPPIRLPHDLTKYPRGASRMSDHLRLRLAAIDDWLTRSGQSDRCYDPEFWAEPINSSYLKCLTFLDWREDLHQLGYMLREIRDNWGGAKHVVTMGNVKDANTFIATFPEELMAWGSSEQIDWNPSSLSNMVKAPVELPHADYRLRIERLVRQLSEFPRAIVLYRQDHDVQYDPALETQPRTDNAKNSSSETKKRGPISEVNAENGIGFTGPDTPVNLSVISRPENDERRRSRITGYLVAASLTILGIVGIGVTYRASNYPSPVTKVLTKADSEAGAVRAVEPANAKTSIAALGSEGSNLAAPTSGAKTATAIDERAINATGLPSDLPLHSGDKPSQLQCRLLSDGSARLASDPTVILSKGEIIAVSITGTDWTYFPRGASDTDCVDWRRRAAEAFVFKPRAKQTPTESRPIEQGPDHQRTTRQVEGTRQDISAPMKQTTQGTKEYFSN